MSKLAAYKRYKRGDRVKIVDQWKGHRHNPSGNMDVYLSKIVTIKAVTCYEANDIRYKIFEDQGEWVWFNEMFDEEYEEPIIDFDELFNILL